MNRHLSGPRMGRLLLKDLVEDYRSIAIALGAITGVLLLNYLLSGIDANGSNRAVELFRSGGNTTLHLTYFALTLFIGGFIITSRSFVELHAKSRNHDWLMLPASPIEKFLGRLLLSSVGVGVGAVIYFFLFSLLGSGVHALVFGRAYPLFNPADGTVWLMVLHYIVLQSLFFAGAVYFKKAHFIKTVLVLTAFFFVLMLLVAGVARLVFWREFTQLTAGGSIANLDFSPIQARLESAGHVVSVISQVVYWAILAPVFWVFAYFRLAEAEVRNGV